MKSLKNMSLFKRFFISYLIVMGLVMVLSVGIYFYSYHIINAQAKQNHQTLLEKMQVEMDASFSESKRNITSLLLDGGVQKAVKVQGRFSMGDREVLYDIFQNLVNKYVSSGKMTHIFIYFMEGNTIISEQGHIDSRLFYEMNYEGSGWSYDDFLDVMNRKWSGSTTIVWGRSGEPEILYLQNAFPRGIRNPDATFGVSISQATASRMMEEQRWSDEVQLLMISDDGVVIAGNELKEAMEEDDMRAVETMLSGEGRISIGETSYQVLGIHSKEAGFSYVALTPVGNIVQGARKIQIFMLLGMMVCVTVGLLAAYIFTSIHYNPLRHIMDMFGHYKIAEDGQKQNEYQWLTEQTLHFLDEHRDIKQRFYDNERIIRSQYLYLLITMPYQARGEAAEKLKEEDFFQKPDNLVMLLYFTGKGDVPWNENMESGLLRFILANVIEELVGGRYRVEAVTMQDCVACVVNGAESGPEAREEMENILEQLQKFIEDRMSAQIFTACGGVTRGIEGVHSSYMMAREASGYQEQMKEQQVIWYEDVENKPILYDYTIEAEQRIINAISAGEEESACRWVNEVLEENFCQRKMRSSMKRCLLFELMGTVMKGAEQGGGTELMNNLPDERVISSKTNLEDARAYFQSQIQTLCRGIRLAEQKKREDSQFSKRVMEYVQQHFQDPDLNISITAMHFNITPSYLSALFKEQTGMGLLEYINKARVEKVKELLEQGMNVIDICERTGFRSSGALIRVFKKMTGITPGQMKRIKE